MWRKALFVILVSGLWSLVSSLSWAMYPYEKPKELFKPGEVIVKFKPAKIEAESIKILNQKFNVIKSERVFKIEVQELANVYKLSLPKEADILSMVEEYKKDPNVEYAEPNYIVYIMATTPNDPSFNLQWGLNEAADHDIDAPEAWDITKGTSSEIIAIVDTGCNYNHEDLSSKLWLNTADPINFIDDDLNGYVDDYRGWDFVNSDNIPLDDHGHGTHVSGIAAATTNNSLGIAGTNWNARLMILKVLDWDGSGTTTDVANGITYAANKGATVINLSLGSTSESATITNAINYAYNTKGCVVVAAAGNDNVSTPYYPANTANVIAVAATDSDDKKAGFSNYGTWIDVSAPGNSIYSTYYLTNSSYTYMNGTSMATPFVCGMAALIKAQYPTWTNAQIANRIKDTTDNIDSLNPLYAGKLGTGRVNAYKALGVPVASITSPAVSSEVSGNVTVTGTATDENFKDYKLEYGAGSSPSSWTQIAFSTTPVESGTLGIWNTANLLGLYTLKLTATDQDNNISTAEVGVYVIAPGDLRLMTPTLPAPNPFNPLRESTTIYYRLSRNADITLYIFDLTGTLIWKAIYLNQIAGDNTAAWNGISNFGEVAGNGIYIYQIVANGKVLGKGKIIVLK